MVIASANLIAVRPGDKILGGYIMIFLESPIGKALLGSFQRGTTVMNINYTDIMEMEITLPEKREQQQIVEEYQSELILYTESLVKAEKRFAKTKDIIYRKLF
jgi:restriction endonuclease S subunit